MRRPLFDNRELTGAPYWRKIRWPRHVTCKGRVATHVSLYAIACRDVKRLRRHVTRKICCSLRCTQFYVEPLAGFEPATYESVRFWVSTNGSL